MSRRECTAMAASCRLSPFCRVHVDEIHRYAVVRSVPNVLIVVAHMLDSDGPLRLVRTPGTVEPDQLVPVHCHIRVLEPFWFGTSALTRTSSEPNAAAMSDAPMPQVPGGSGGSVTRRQWPRTRCNATPSLGSCRSGGFT